MKLIDADELLKKLTDIKHSHKYAIEKASIYECMDAIRHTPVKDISWIPVSKRLPEYDRDYNIRYDLDKEYLVMIIGVSEPTILYFSEDGSWYDGDGNYYQVSAWMEKPEPYRSEDTNV